MPRDYDLVLYGATGYAGRHAIDHLVEHAPEGLRWAVAGRNAAKLEATLADRGGPKVGVVVADASDVASLEALCASTTVVASFVGPFAQYGTPLVEACIRQGTDYVDITGETPWVRGLIDRLQGDAEAKKVKLVPLAGFDSVPSDLGAFMTARAVQSTGQQCEEVVASFRMKVGGLNGGTWATLLSSISDPEVGKAYRDRILLNPPSARSAEVAKATARDRVGPHHDPDLGWTAPFVMATANTRVVRRSAAMLDAWDDGYGTGFRYEEGLGARSKFAAARMGWGLGAAFACALFPPTRALMKRFGPKQGEGPSAEKMAGAGITVSFVGRGSDGAKARGKIKADGDASNHLTAAFAVQTALALALDRDRLPGAESRFGFLTASTAAGDVLLERLRAIGQCWTVEVD
jgi:short subunit dehydrogenase-like uncharacterized protein